MTTSFGELDVYLAREGRHERLYDKLGAHVRDDGVAFAVWAPNARAVSVVGDFNGWDATAHPMQNLGDAGIWEAFVAGVEIGHRYKYELVGADGRAVQKADPFAFATEVPPRTGSVVHRSDFAWSDDKWIARRRETDPLQRPISIYEVHLGSWRLNPVEGNRQLTYRELAAELAD